MILEKELQNKFDSLIGFEVKLSNEYGDYSGVLIYAKVNYPNIDVEFLWPDGKIMPLNFFCYNLYNLRDFKIEIVKINE